MKILVQNKQKDLAVSAAAVKKIVAEVIAYENRHCDEVTVHFVTTKKISELHQDFFQDPTTTDCISFPMDEDDLDIGYKILGEIFVCPKTAIDYAASHNTTALEETTLYIIHGLLHLMGYDDLEPKMKAAMRRAEKKHMNHLRKLKLMLYSGLDQSRSI
jgi:probable rRNA maturation factor